MSTQVNKAVDEINDQIKQIVSEHEDKKFQNGDCFLFYKLLKAVYPEAIPFYDPVSGHVYTFLLNRLWDSRGLRMFPMESQAGLIEYAETWKP